MKVLLVNGSPHEKGCTYTALCEIADTLRDNGIDSEIFWIGTKPISGCIACLKCNELGQCVFDDAVNRCAELAVEQVRQAFAYMEAKEKFNYSYF